MAIALFVDRGGSHRQNLLFVMTKAGFMWFMKNPCALVIVLGSGLARVLTYD